MKKKIAMYVVILVFIISAPIFISRYFAIQHTIQECNHFHLRQIEPIQKIDTSFYLLRYLPNYTQNDYYKRRFSPYLPVWAVDMEGTWEIFGGPPPEPGQPELPPQRFYTCGSTINFFTTYPIGTFAK